jgi:hypothetical protein
MVMRIAGWISVKERVEQPSRGVVPQNADRLRSRLKALADFTLPQKGSEP